MKIILRTKLDSLEEKIKLTYNLIVLNRENLITYIFYQKLTNPKSDLNAFHYYINYFYNYIILFLLLYKSPIYNNPYIIINHLIQKWNLVLLFINKLKEK